jgi:D-glycero-alpha-D-manno-heptose-7-phosphate kinase
MIIVRSPLRISLGGGGTDLPTYYQNHGGFVISAAIDKYVYVIINDSFKDKIVLKYSKHEEVDTIDQIEHPAFREALKLAGIHGGLDITNISDVPAGTGLGSSGSFNTALLKALYTKKRGYIDPADLAERAYYIERHVLKQPVGKQDQYISAVGGVTSFTFHKDDSVSFWPTEMPTGTLEQLEENLLLFFMGYSREASSILEHQDRLSAKHNGNMFDNLDNTKEMGYVIESALRSGDLEKFAYMMNEHWKMKSRRSPGMSNSLIDEAYKLGLTNGALGGKLVGAGAGGFLMFYAEDKFALRQAMSKAGFKELRFRFDFEGTKVVHS